jgi:peptide/nickel transport system substrate-binding protein
MATGLRFTRRQLLWTMAATGLTAAFYPKIAVSQDGKILRVRSYADIQNLDPAFRKGSPEDDIMRNIFVGLVTSKAGDEWGWELDGAESINQVDPTHIEFTLREGLTWSDGFGPVTADDVKFSYERMADPKMESPYAGDWAALDHVEVKDDRSGVIVLKQPSAPLWFTTLLFGSGCIVSRKAVEAAGGKFETTVPAQCGRYVIKEWQPKQKVILGRNPDWKGAAPAWDEIHVIPIEDEKVAELAFEGGDLDYTWVAVSSIPRYRETPPAGGKVEVKPSLAYVWLGMNQEFPPFDNADVRRGIQHAIDVPGALDAAYFGAVEAATGLIAPGLIGHREKVLYGHDPEKARELLKKAGVDGGFEFKLSLLNKSTFLSIAQAIQAQLAEFNITVTIDQHDSGTFWTLGDQASGDSWKSIQMVLDRFSMQPDPSFATEWFTPDQIGVWNWERWNSPEFGELEEKAKVELDAKKRHEMYVHMQDLMEEGGSYIFLTHEAVGVAYRDTIVPAIMPDGRPVFHKFKPA